MRRINQLPKNIWEKIAAGEVVERPASVVKELLENSIDAGAKNITLEIQSGGIKYIRITDDGSGIYKEDVPLAFVSHATSKINKVDDLGAILTLGFRGEALASVAAVSRTEILTKTEDEELGTMMHIEGGEQVLLDDAGCPKGTTIIIRDLFFNTPARMKFLKSDRAEGMAVADIAEKIAISHPEISVRFIKDGKEMLCTNGSGKLYDAIFSVYGKDFAETLIPVDYDMNGIKVHGFVSRPFNSRGSNSMQIFFVNNRFIKSRRMSAALNESYKNSIMVGKYPACVLFFDMLPELVDVNAHPTKTEVRFSNEKAMFDVVYYGVKNALEADSQRVQAKITPKVNTDILAAATPEVHQETFATYKPQPEAATTNFSALQKSYVSPKQENKEYDFTDEILPVFNQPAEKYNSMKTDEDEIDLSVRTADVPVSVKVEAARETVTESKTEIKEINFKYLGEAFKTYIFVEYNGKLCIIDKHAAHERMIYNSLKKDNGANGSQMFLSPQNIMLSKKEYVAVIENLDVLHDAGFEIEDFGNGAVIVRACPLNLEKEDMTELVTEIASYLVENRKILIPEKLDWIYHSMSCRAAVKAGNNTTDYELIEFVKDLLCDESVRYCPHGRPVLIELSKYEIDKQFGRV